MASPEFSKPEIGLHPPKEYDLEELLHQIDLSNLHEELEFGRPTGKEVW